MKNVCGDGGWLLGWNRRWGSRWCPAEGKQLFVGSPDMKKSFLYFLPISCHFLVAQTVQNLPAMWETRIQSLGQEDPLEKGMATHSSILAWRIPWTDHGIAKSRTRLTTDTFTFLCHQFMVCTISSCSCHPAISQSLLFIQVFQSIPASSWMCSRKDSWPQTHTSLASSVRPTSISTLIYLSAWPNSELCYSWEVFHVKNLKYTPSSQNQSTSFQTE